MTDKTQIAEAVLKLFKGREDDVPYQKKGSHWNHKPVEEPITAQQLVEAHLDGECCIGFYLLNDDDCVHCTCLDFDDHDGTNPNVVKDAIKAHHALGEMGLSSIIERSQSGTGYHVWLLFDQATPGIVPVQFWKAFKTRYGFEGVEHYPRQASLDRTTKGLGNLIRIPLYNQSAFIKLYNTETWETRLVPEHELAKFLDNVERTNEKDLAYHLDLWGISYSDDQLIANETALPDNVYSLIQQNKDCTLVRRFANDRTGMYDTSTSAVVQSILVELVRAFIPTDDIIQTAQYWCELHGYEKGLRPGWIEDSLSKAYDQAAGRLDRRALTGDTFCALAHQYADSVLAGNEIIIPTGVSMIDESIEGLGQGELAVVSARPNHGKTAFTMAWMDHAAKMGYTTLLASLEMSASENSRRVLLNVAKTSKSDWKTTEGNEHVHNRLNEHYGKRAPMYFVEGAYTLDRIEAVVDDYVREHGVQMVVVDYVGLATAGFQTEYQNQTEIAKRLKRCARKNNVAIVAIVQMNRGIEGEPDRVPRGSDLRGSGEWEQTADLILFCRWPYKDDPSLSLNEYMIYATKCRNRGIVHPHMVVQFFPEEQRFA